jgi:quercetin dioxygenase-like cupin family protein
MPDPKVDEAIAGRAVVLDELMEVQAGAVVSRTLLQRPTGTITLFGFDAGEGLSEHSAPFDALVHVLDGALDITISGDPLHASRGSTVVMPADEPHALTAIEPTRMLLVMIRS